MDESALIKFHNHCKVVARTLKRAALADDFAQWAVIKKLEGRTAIAYHLLIDYLREHQGRPGTGCFQMKHNINVTYNMLPEQRGIEFRGNAIDTGSDEIMQRDDDLTCSTPSFEEELINHITRDKWIAKLTPKQKEVVELLTLGFNQQQISVLLRVSQSRISQIVRLEIPTRIALSDTHNIKI